MKPKTSLLGRALLAATMLYAPSTAMAQQSAPAQPQTPAAEEPVAEEGEIVVQGRFIPEPMRETSEIASFLTSADLARTGDDNAASALTRLTGLSVVSDRFVFVRGLGDRYSSALLNGSPLPSPEPLRRQVPLDLFPSNLLGGAVVQKTFSPNFPGEFGGGVIDLQTLRLPSETFLTAKVSTGANTATTETPGLFYEGSKSDWTGFDDGLRDIPGPLAAALRQPRLITRENNNFTPAELQVIGRSLVNSPLTVVERADRPLDLEGELTGGTSIDFDQYNLGLVGVIGYDNQWRTKNAIRTDVVGNVINSDARTLATSNDVVLNAFGSANLSWADQEIGANVLFVQSATKFAQVETGVDFNRPGADPLNPRDNYRKESTAWYERQLAMLQLSGEHEFDALELKWRTAFAQSKRDAPYERFAFYDVAGGQATVSGGFGNQTRFSELKDEVASTGIDGTYTIPLSENRDLTLSAGLAHSNTVRRSELYTFAFFGPFDLPPDVQRARIDFLLSEQNITPTRFEISERTGADDSYKGRLTNLAGYFMADFEPIPLVRASIGVRYEDATQIVRTFNRFGRATTPSVTLDNTYWLPAATLTWNFAEDLQLRAGYSETIARPQFRELALTPYIDPDTDRIFQGNPFLRDTTFKNYDARVEYYFGREQFVTGGLFYKQIENPIEEVVVRLDRFQTRFINAPEATLYGLELEYRTRFDMPFDVPFLDGETWRFAVNYTYTSSEVNAPAGTRVISPLDFQPTPAVQFGLDGSQLVGTPENIANVQLGYDTDDAQLTLLVGWVDKRILRRGLGSVAPVFDDPGVNVDLVYRHDFKIGEQEFTFGASGRNLLGTKNEEFQTYQRGRNEVNTYDRGTSISVSLTARY